MKKTLLYLAILAGFSYSCADWLDVHSSANITQDEMFSNGQGYRNALNGVYRLLGDKALYGKELTWGIVSALGHNYDVGKLPVGYQTIIAGNVTSKDAQDITKHIWEKGYNVITNCNNLIAHAENADPSIFEFGEMEKDLILGEMYGVRAMMHFQLLQLFAPTPIVAAQDKKYIPYVKKYPDHIPVYLTVKETMDEVINDFNLSRDKLAPIDTIINVNASWTDNARFSTVLNSVTGGRFFGLRGTRMNYFAATALLARAYLWNGNNNEAMRLALNIYRYHNKYVGADKVITNETRFNYTNITTTNINEYPRKIPGDILFACYNTKAYEIYTTSITSQISFVYKNVPAIFTNPVLASNESAVDFRSSKLIETDNSSRRWAEPAVTTSSTTQNIIKIQGPLLPVIRMSEMVHIIAECGGMTQGLRPMYELRFGRGFQGSGSAYFGGGTGLENPNDISEAEFEAGLRNDIVREYMSEGRTFFFFKRKNEPVYNGSTPAVDMSKSFILMPPDSEIIY